jgi:hypothetical protein
MVGTKPTFADGSSDLRKARIESTVRCKTREDLERTIAADMFKGSGLIQAIIEMRRFNRCPGATVKSDYGTVSLISVVLEAMSPYKYDCS